VTNWAVADTSVAMPSAEQPDPAKSVWIKGVSPRTTRVTASTACQSSAATAEVRVLDMAGSWTGQETWESSSCPAVTLEVHNCTIAQTGNLLRRYCHNYYTGGYYTYTGTFTGPAFQWTLDAPAQWGQGAYTLSASESGTVTDDGMNYSSTAAWMFTYTDENGVQQYCNGASGSRGVRLSAP
jgi:hypothetical protein